MVSILFVFLWFGIIVFFLLVVKFVRYFIIIIFFDFVRVLSVGVIIFVCNEVENIEDCLVSFIKFSYPNFEIIVVDDCSVDRTVELV